MGKEESAVCPTYCKHSKSPQLPRNYEDSLNNLNIKTAFYYLSIFIRGAWNRCSRQNQGTVRIPSAQYAVKKKQNFPVFGTI